MKGIVIIFIFLTNIAFGQDTTKTRTKELYLSLTNFSPMQVDIYYKKQIGAKTFFKIGAINLSAFRDTNKESSLDKPTSSGYSGGLQLGIEFRKTLTDKFLIYHGPNIRYSYSNQTIRWNNPSWPSNSRDISMQHTGSIPYSIGILFKINAHILIAAELNPSISVSRRSRVYKNQDPANYRPNNKTTSVSFGLNDNSFLSFVYRF